jgi:5-methylcytosine-specific restriction endonuclease McrA
MPSPNPPPARRKWDQKYNQTEKARAAARRYYYSEKGQQAKMAYRAAYKPTPEQQARYREAGRLHEREWKYKARRKRYDQTAKGQAAKAARDKRFANTEKGRFSKRKTEIKRKHQIETSSCTLTREQWQEIKAAHGHACAYCKRLMQRLEMDHVIPLSKGGSHTKDNIVPACRKCNAKKGNRSLNEFVSAEREPTAGCTKTVILRTRQPARIEQN